MAIKRALTVQNMIEMKTKQLPFEGEWYNAFEKCNRNMVYLW